MTAIASNLVQMVDHDALGRMANFIREDLRAKDESHDGGNPKTWWIYRRVSDPEKQSADEEGYQYQEAWEYVDKLRRPGDVVETRVDGVSAYHSAFLDRPAAKEILEKAKPGDELVAYALDRFGRSVATTVPNMMFVAKRGIVVHTLHPEFVTAFANPSSTMILNVLAALAQWEAEMTGMRTSSALQARSRLGLPINANPKYGYRRIRGPVYRSDGSLKKAYGIIRYERDDAEVALILRVADRYFRGEPLSILFAEINRLGIRRADEAVGKWTYLQLWTAVKFVRTNPAYYGADVQEALRWPDSDAPGSQEPSATVA